MSTYRKELEQIQQALTKAERCAAAAKKEAEATKMMLVQIQRALESAQTNAQTLHGKAISDDDLDTIIELLESKLVEYAESSKKAAHRIVMSATDPDSDAFIDAVNEHRIAMANFEYVTDLVQRIKDARDRAGAFPHKDTRAAHLSMQGIKPEIQKMLVLSTAHITPDTAKLLAQEPETDKLGLAVYEEKTCNESYGWFIGFSGIELDPDSIPADLLACINLAKDCECDMLCLDRDGLTTSHLEVFCWD